MNGETLRIIKGYVKDVSGPGMTAHQLSIHSGTPLALARQRLFSAEAASLLCRDASLQGLAFFPNLFLQKDN